MDENVLKYCGEIHSITSLRNNQVISSSNGKYFLAKRDPTLSTPKAITKISKFGITPVILIGHNYILEKFIKFEYKAPSLKQLAYLLRDIHNNNYSQGTLVHGDFSKNNTTIYKGNLHCLDYEFSHFGNPYVDIGRIILRECNNEDDINDFFKFYSGGVPPLKLLQEGLSYFCDWQHLIRKRKKFPFQNIPLVRKERISESGKNYKQILKAFKDKVFIQHG